MLQKNTINILGTSLELEHHDGWNTLIIQYPCIEGKEMKCTYTFNGEKGAFTQNREKTDHTLLIGEKEKKANILLGSLELYCNVFRDEFELPEVIIDIIERDMEARLDLD